jgi:biopolymer transport protein ExbD
MRKRKFTEINVVPFIDIVLVLLVIVLATATFIVKKELPVDLPKAGSSLDLPKKSITITIDSNGTFFYQKKRVTLEELKSKLSLLNPKKDLITIDADQKSQFQKFVAVVDILKSKGFQKISITTVK